MPLPANGAGSGPLGARRCTGTGQHDEPDHARPAPGAVGDAHRDRSRPVPGGTRATHPVGERLSLVANAPFDHRKVTRIPAFSPVPRSWTCWPIMTMGRGWQAARVAGTHRSPVSFGGGVRAWAAVGASAAASRTTIARLRPCCILLDNRSDTAKSRPGGGSAGSGRPYLLKEPPCTRTASYLVPSRRPAMPSRAAATLNWRPCRSLPPRRRGVCGPR